MEKILNVSITNSFHKKQLKHWNQLQYNTHKRDYTPIFGLITLSLAMFIFKF